MDKREETESIEDEREVYETPRLEYEDLYEVLALACGKVLGGGGPIGGPCTRLSKLS